MQFVQGFLLVSSSILIGVVSAYALTHRRTTGALEMGLLGIFAIIWSIGSFFETQCGGLSAALLWRNVQQIAVFGLPAASLYFAVQYTGRPRLLKFAHMAAGVCALAVLLIFTDPIHHIMRTGSEIVESAVYGRALVVHSTAVGTLFVAFNFTLPLAAVALMAQFALKAAPGIRRQVFWIILGFLGTFLAAFSKLAFLEHSGIYIQISVLYIPGALILYFSLFRFGFFRLSPVARDKVFEVISQGILVVDRDGIVLEANSAALRIVRDYFADTPIGIRLEDVKEINPAISGLLKSKGEQRAEIVLNRSGGEVYLSVDHYPLDTRRGGAVLLINNITMQKLHEHELMEKADSDAMTGLLNRSGFESTFAYIRRKVKESGQHLSLFMMDLDNFKSINDSFGHSAGDQVLIHFAQLLRSSLREEDIIGRIGGEEFAVLLPNIRSEDAGRIAERIRQKVCQAKVLTAEGIPVNYTVSIGVTDNRQMDRELGDFLAEADIALYRAKHQDRNCTVIYG